MWNYVKDGYRDFSAYFNTYYNASVAYEAGLKDVLKSKKEYEISVISGASPPVFAIAAADRQNFDLAIQEASKVLQFYPNSEFTEDCLYLIGISYYYEGNTMGGERKFTEAEAAFPKSKRIDQAEMYKGALQINGQQVQQGLSSLSQSRVLARKQKDRKVLSMSADILSAYYLGRGDSLTAASYLDSAGVTSDGDDAAMYYCLEGNLLSAVGRNDSAIHAYQIACERARDIRLRFYSRYYLARALRDEHRYYLALDNLKKLRGDDKYFTYFPLVDYQHAEVLNDSGIVSTAVAEFQKIDTVAASSEASTRSTYQLGKIYLYGVGDYQTALKFFQKCASHPAVQGMSAKAQKMASALQEYFIASYKLALSDSLYFAALRSSDSADTAKRTPAAVVDTLYEHAAEARHQLAGFFLFKLEIPDSAVRSYKIVVNDFPKSRVCPSALYTLGEYFYSSGDTVAGDKYLDELIERYPASIYATSAGSLLDKPIRVVVDSSQMVYDKAIKYIDGDSDDSAVACLNLLLSDTRSSILPQTLYTLGWIYENKLERPDSAYVYYHRLVKFYPSSKLSESVTLALTGYEDARQDSVKAEMKVRDSLKTSANKPTLTKGPLEPLLKQGKVLEKPDSTATKIQTLPADTSESKKRLMKK